MTNLGPLGPILKCRVCDELLGPYDARYELQDQHSDSAICLAFTTRRLRESLEQGTWVDVLTMAQRIYSTASTQHEYVRALAKSICEIAARRGGSKVVAKRLGDPGHTPSVTDSPAAFIE